MNIKEKIYKNYLSNHLDEFELINEINLLNENLVKENGIVYTPIHIVQHMIEIANPTLEMNIIEPSCGHGIFLIGLLEYISKKYTLTGEELYSWFINKVIGVEIQENTVKELKEILSLYFKKHFNLNTKEYEFTNIHCHDGLTFDNEKQFNLCIGNPPYIRAKNLSNDYLQFLKNNFQSCKKGTIDIYFAFIEKYMNSCDNLVFITPNSFLYSKSGQEIKKNIINKLEILIDFKDIKIFKNTGTYTCIFKTNNITYQNKKILYGNNFNKLKETEKTKFLSKENKTKKTENILSGIATLCDKIFLVKKAYNGKFYANYNDNLYEIEKEIIAPYLKLTKIKSQKDLENINYMIFPYKNDKKIISEEELKNNYPLTYKYLLITKNRLLERDKGKTEKYESWYAYGRKQGIHNITENNIIVIPQMINNNCKPLKINIEKILKEFNKIIFTSGYLIQENKNNKKICEYILSEKFINFARENGKPWPGKEEPYYDITSRQINNIDF